MYPAIQPLSFMAVEQATLSGVSICARCHRRSHFRPRSRRLVNGRGTAPSSTRERVDIEHGAVVEESARELIPCENVAHSCSVVVDAIGDAGCFAECAKVLHCPIIQKSMLRHISGGGGLTYNLTIVIDAIGDSVITTEAAYVVIVPSYKKPCSVYDWLLLTGL